MDRDVELKRINYLLEKINKADPGRNKPGLYYHRETLRIISLLVEASKGEAGMTREINAQQQERRLDVNEWVDIIIETLDESYQDIIEMPKRRSVLHFILSVAWDVFAESIKEGGLSPTDVLKADGSRGIRRITAKEQIIEKAKKRESKNEDK